MEADFYYLHEKVIKSGKSKIWSPCSYPWPRKCNADHRRKYSREKNKKKNKWGGIIKDNNFMITCADRENWMAGLVRHPHMLGYKFISPHNFSSVGAGALILTLKSHVWSCHGNLFMSLPVIHSMDLVGLKHLIVFHSYLLSCSLWFLKNAQMVVLIQKSYNCIVYCYCWIFL